MTPDFATRWATQDPDGRRPQVMQQRWESLLFAHWRVSPARLQETLPSGLYVDTFAGDGYVGVVPFFMRNIRPVGLPALPWLSNFQELNVRTYVYDGAGVPGVWFYSLDCNQRLAVLAAQLSTGLPYFRAEMRATLADYIDYSCRRLGTIETATYRYRGAGEASEADPSSLEFFLLHRYYLYAMRRAALVRAQVSHQRYRYREARVERCSAVPARLDGFEELDDSPEHVCFVDGLDVKIYATEQLG